MRRLRVISGVAGSIPLAGPPAGVRPTSERVRETLFASLGSEVEGRPFVDMYAGCGAVGIEALSRGADRCLFVERSIRCVAVIKENLRRTGLVERATVWRADVERVLAKVIQWIEDQPAIIFLDPPYAVRRVGEVIRGLLGDSRLPKGTVVILEHSSSYSCTSVKEPCWQRQVGQSCLSRWEA